MSRSGPTAPVPMFDDATDVVTTLNTERVRACRRHDVGHHTHDAHELLWGFDGPRTIETDSATWLLPPTVGLWIPAGTPHTGIVAENSSYYCTFVHPERVSTPWTTPTTIAITPVLRELLVHLHRAELTLDERLRAERVVVDLVRPVSSSTVALPMPLDERARLVATAITTDPRDRRTLEQWGHHVGAAGRTLNRIFARQTGMTFNQWRVHARVRAAIPLLASGQPVASVGQCVGYRTPSAFVRAFRRSTGDTPGAYLATRPYVASATTAHDVPRYDTIKS